MYNFTDSQKNVAKWLLQSVREGNLNEEFYIHWYPFRRGFPLVKFSNYKGTPESLENITQASINVLAENQLLIYKVIQSMQDLSFKPFKPPLEEIWDCTLTGRIYTAVAD